MNETHFYEPNRFWRKEKIPVVSHQPFNYKLKVKIFIEKSLLTYSFFLAPLPMGHKFYS